MTDKILNQKTKSLLKAIPYFRNLNDTGLAAIAAEVITRQYAAGEIIFLEGEADAGLHLVVEGLCKVYRLSEQGREQILVTLGPGDSCNEVPAVDGGPNPANFATIKQATVWIITGATITRLRHNHPTINDSIIKNLAMRCRQLVQQVYNLSFLSVTGRLADFLLQQSDNQPELSRQQWTQDEIAAHLGTVRETVARAFKELQQANLIKLDRHRIEIVDWEGLKKLT